MLVRCRATAAAGAAGPVGGAARAPYDPHRLTQLGEVFVVLHGVAALTVPGGGTRRPRLAARGPPRLECHGAALALRIADLPVFMHQSHTERDQAAQGGLPQLLARRAPPPLLVFAAVLLAAAAHAPAATAFRPTRRRQGPAARQRRHGIVIIVGILAGTAMGRHAGLAQRGKRPAWRWPLCMRLAALCSFSSVTTAAPAPHRLPVVQAARRLLADRAARSPPAAVPGRRGAAVRADRPGAHVLGLSPAWGSPATEGALAGGVIAGALLASRFARPALLAAACCSAILALHLLTKMSAAASLLVAGGLLASALPAHDLGYAGVERGTGGCWNVLVEGIGAKP